MKIIIASKNPAKIKAALEGFSRMFPEAEITVEGLSVPSNVPDQPIGDAQTREGAINRASGARAAQPNADYYVGLEGGVLKEGDDYFVMGWVAIQNTQGQQGLSRGGSLPLPPAVSRLLDQGMELGDADDIVFKDSNSKQGQGASGILTGGAIPRTAGFTHCVILALAPFRNPDLYELNGELYQAA